MQMKLTAEQQQSIKRGAPVRVTEPQTNLECVVVRADVYERMRKLIYDDSPWTDEEKALLAEEAGESIGWNERELQEYDNYEAHERP
jgi:hypothetical protein